MGRVSLLTNFCIQEDRMGWVGRQRVTPETYNVLNHAFFGPGIPQLMVFNNLKKNTIETSLERCFLVDGVGPGSFCGCEAGHCFH